ncbi:uncharacterized protein stbd1 [Cyprinodon tularosa]|uniref:uncharacterized protein stbd1 n=1 Tax=Cyprinodon tularosa TaxID=77115 RepID=UPI0018E1E04F|nr:uncharacterized protein stbd1 [Cyprinodon tularosa]
MQLKNNNPVAMEKRTDLASLFCMIGHHGPAVAVAVIAMVSVVAGLIIYRTVKGKRRKAEAGPGDPGSCSPGAVRDTSLLQPEKEPSTGDEAHELVESTDFCEEDLITKDPDVNLNMANLRNRRVAAENNLQSGLPEREVKPDKLSSASRVEEKPTVPLENEATKSLQDDTCKVKDCNMESATEDKLKEMPCQGEENQYAENNPVCCEENARNLNEGDEKGNKAISESISTDDYLKEQTIDMHESPLPTNNDNIPVTDILINSQPANNLSENMEQHKSLTMPLPTDADAEQVPIIEVAENNLPQLGELSGNDTLLISEKRLEQDLSNCSKENITDVKQFSCSETKETSSLVLGTNLPYLSVEPEIPQDGDQTLPLDDQQPVDKTKDEVNPELAATNNSNLTLASMSPQRECEMVNEILIIKENAEAQSLANGQPDAVEVSTAESVSTEMSCPDSSFKEETEQLRNEDLEVPTTPTTVMAESIEPQTGKNQLLDEEQMKLSLSSPDDGDESGVSSMTISPDLPDNECPLTSESLQLDIGDRSQSEGQAAHVVPDCSNDLQTGIYCTEANDDPCTINECHEMESLKSEVNKLSIDIPTVCVSEDLEKMKAKIVIEGKQDGEEEEKTTEINIMEATMDNNEWITDGTDQVLPWMKPSVPQTDPESVENILSFSSDAAGTNTTVPLVSEAKESNTFSPTDKLVESGKRVLTVHPMPQNVNVTFQTHYVTCTPFQKVAVTGNNQELGNWKDFIPLEKAKDGLWATVVSLPAESHVEWKFIVVDRGEVCRWEECGNRLLDTGNRENLLVQKFWGFK